MFFLTISVFMSGLAPVAVLFPQERLVFLKEQNSRLYSVFSYFLSRNIIEAPYLLIVPFLFNVIFYFLVGLAPTVEQFLYFYLISFLVGLCGNSLGLLLGSSITNAKAVSAAMPIMITPFILVSGYFKNSENIPLVLNWIQLISPLKYCFAAMLTN